MATGSASMVPKSIPRRSPSVVFRLRGGVAPGPGLIVHLDGYAVPQLEDARCNDFLARLDAGGDGDEVSLLGAELHDLLAHAPVGLPIRARELLDDVDGVSIGGV